MTARSSLRHAVPVAARGGRALALAALLLAPLLAGVVPGVAPARPALAAPGTFSNAGAIVVPDPDDPETAGTGAGRAKPYPSAIEVSGEVGPIAKVTVTLRNLTHRFLSDLDVLLVAPSGQSLLLLSDVGPDDDAVAYLTLTFDDDAAGPVPVDGPPIATGTYRPTDVAFGDDDAFPVPPAPAPAPPGPPWGTTLSVFTGRDPNGVWRLFVVDQFALDGGTIAGGWSLEITTAGPAPTPTAPATATPTTTATLAATAAPTGTAPAAALTATAAAAPQTGTATALTIPTATGTPAAPAASPAALTAAPTAAGSGAARCPNRRPTARGDQAATAAGVAVALVVTDNDSDPDDDPLKIKEVRQPHHGAATCAPVDPTAFRRRWRCVYTPASDFAGPDDFAYAVEDPSGETATATVHVAVAPAPTATPTATVTPSPTATATATPTPTATAPPATTPTPPAAAGPEEEAAEVAAPDEPAAFGGVGEAAEPAEAPEAAEAGAGGPAERGRP